MSFDLTYNGIKLANVLTREFQQEPVHDASGTDTIYQKFRIGVEAIVSADSLAAGLTNLGLVSDGSAVGGGTTGQVLQSARTKLMEERGSLVYYQNGAAVVSASPSNDCNNGPKPISLHTTRLSEKTFKIVYVIECGIVDCTQFPSQILNNRWSCADDIDEDFVTTRRWQGRLRLSSIHLNAQAYRGLVVPVLQVGWKRVSMNFLADPTGLELAYEIVDRQIHGDSAPFPATKMSGVHTESLDQSGATGTANITVNLTGPPGADRRVLLTRCGQILNAKVAIQSLNEGWITSLSFSEYFGDGVNSVSGTVIARRKMTEGQTGQITAAAMGAMSLKTIGAPMRELNLELYADGGSYLTGPYPTTTTGLFICYLQTPCVDVHGMPQASDGTPNISGLQESSGGGSNYPSISANQGSIPDSFAKAPNYSAEHSSAIYTHSAIESHYIIDEGRVFLPIAKPGGSLADGQDTATAVRLYPRTAKRIIRAEFERIGAPPELWKLADFSDGNGIKHYLLGFTPNFRPPETTGDGRTIYIVDAEYVFGLSRPPAEGEKYSSGSLPWDTSSAGDNKYLLGNDPAQSKGLG